VFVSERKASLSSRSIRHIIARAGELAGIPFQVNPHQLRHAYGCATHLVQNQFRLGSTSLVNELHFSLLFLLLI
jgi:site-specific recombinase XerD